MTQHTPGPWEWWDEGSDNPNSTQGVRTSEAEGVQSRTIALCDEEFRRIPQEERAANARLIAAAPELLEALRDLIIACNMSPGQELTVSLAIENANAAIAKAETLYPRG